MNNTSKKVMLLFLIGLIFAGYFYFDLSTYFTLDTLQGSKERLNEFYNQNTIGVIAGFFLVYVIMAAFSLPGAAVMTLAAGVIFGFALGLLVSSFASSLGALLATVVARYVLGDWVEEKFGDRLKKINEGIKKEGAFYLFTLRLIPIFPFFVINLVIGLTKMPLKTYYWVSQLGMLPGTAVYVFAGVQLSEVSAIGDIFSFELILAFVLIGLFPLIAKKSIELYKKYRKIQTNI